MQQLPLAILFGPVLLGTVPTSDGNVPELIARVRAVNAQGNGSADARAARDKLAAMGPEVLPELLDGMDTPDTVAANWLRTAFDEIVERTVSSEPKSIPVRQIHRYLLDPQREGRSRRLALAVLARLDPALPKRLIPTLLDDPEFRYDAVAGVLEQGDRELSQQNKRQAIAAFTKAFDAARDESQVRTAAGKLEALDRKASIVEHLGYLVDWYLIGPFDGPGFEAFSTVYPPEREVNLKAAYEGKSGPITWQRHRTGDQFGTVNLAGALAQVDSAVAYAYTTVQSDRRRELQIRCGADDNLTIWLNGAKVFAKEEWKNGTRFDRFRVPVTLRKGENRILVKVCNAPPYADPALGNPWSVQMRICDATGKGVVLPTLTALPVPKTDAGS